MLCMPVSAQIYMHQNVIKGHLQRVELQVYFIIYFFFLVVWVFCNEYFFLQWKLFLFGGNKKVLPLVSEWK